MRSRSLTALLFLAGFFIAALVACNLLVNKFFMFTWPGWFPILGGELAVLVATLVDESRIDEQVVVLQAIAENGAMDQVRHALRSIAQF